MVTEKMRGKKEIQATHAPFFIFPRILK